MTRCVVDVDGDIVRMTFDGASRRNALDAVFWGEFGGAMDAVADAAPRAIVLTGAGDVFCAGGDIARMRDSLVAMRSGEFEGPERERMERIDDLLLRWCAFEVPKIGAVNGPAVGAGLAFAASCDYTVVADGAFFDTGFARLGLPGDMGVTHYLPRAVGPRRATQWLLRPRRVGAEEAVSIGIADEVVARVDLDRRVGEIADELASSAPAAVASVLHREAAVTMLRTALDRERDATIAAKQHLFHRAAVERFFASAADSAPTASVETRMI